MRPACGQSLQASLPLESDRQALTARLNRLNLYMGRVHLPAQICSAALWLLEGAQLAE